MSKININNQFLEGSLCDPTFLHIKMVKPIVRSEEKIGINTTNAINSPREKPKILILID